MRNNSLDIFLTAGLLILTIALVVKHTPIIEVPDGVLGFFTGIVFALKLFGIFRMTPVYVRVKNVKKTVFSKKRK